MKAKIVNIFLTLGLIGGIVAVGCCLVGENVMEKNVLGFLSLGIVLMYFLVTFYAVSMMSTKNNDKAMALGILWIVLGAVLAYVGYTYLNESITANATVMNALKKSVKEEGVAKALALRKSLLPVSIIGGVLTAVSGVFYLLWKPDVVTVESLSAEKKKARIRAGERPGVVELLQSYLMVGGTVLGVVVFVAVPLGWVIRWCLFKYKGYGSVKYVGFDNFVRIFTNDPVYWKAVLNTFVFAIGKLLVEIPLAMVTAFILTRKIKFRNFFRAMYFMPSMISVAIMGVVFAYLFSHQSGVVNEIIKIFGGQPVQWFSSETTSMLMLMIASIWQNFGLNMLFFMTGLQSIDPAMYEAATVDGASNTRQFLSITITLLGPVLQMVLMNAILGSLKVSDLVLTFTNGRPNHGTEVMMTYVYKQWFETGSAMNYGYGSACTVVTAVILGLVTLVYLKTTNKSADVY